MSTPAPRARKHLMDPGNPRPTNREPMSLGRVQRWVLSTLAATTILHMSFGLVVAAVFSDRRDAQVGLLVVAAGFGVVALTTALVIHQRRPVSLWLLLGLLPSLAGAWWLWLR